MVPTVVKGDKEDKARKGSQQGEGKGERCYYGDIWAKKVKEPVKGVPLGRATRQREQ